jgi:hypothetical protein
MLGKILTNDICEFGAAHGWAHCRGGGVSAARNWWRFAGLSRQEVSRSASVVAHDYPRCFTTVGHPRGMIRAGGGGSLLRGGSRWEIWDGTGGMGEGVAAVEIGSTEDYGATYRHKAVGAWAMGFPRLRGDIRHWWRGSRSGRSTAWSHQQWLIGSAQMG